MTDISIDQSHSELTFDQQEAAKAFNTWLIKPDENIPFVLSGFAGSGKTFLSKKFLDFWKEYKPLNHRFYSIHNCEIKLTNKILSRYPSTVMYDSVHLYESICSKDQIKAEQFLTLLPRNAMHLSNSVKGDNISQFELQKILSILNCHNPSHSFALLFVEYLKSPFLKKETQKLESDIMALPIKERRKKLVLTQ